MGRTIIIGGLALMAIGGHELLACELSQAPRPVAAAAAATVARKPMRLVLPERFRTERREPAYASLPSRRIILQ
ncbi:hypothetical protein [Rhizorhabdus dicambivorans]|uniref:Uncharacterized protein n=1 Tax=Rhizorhabdus dicambivorans TaxID=1850238 RepID=A0A2A4FT49_9SPHN|nr:hypothetical protein [Rhizorhabdus dicambivorans]PCE40900.1 hypothetical protein COO09_17870 [Rhizorhabdus dicambivorans]